MPKNIDTTLVFGKIIFDENRKLDRMAGLDKIGQ
jgi:hypothetical protein